MLDEPTSGLDADSEQAVFEALERLMKERTSIVIAHHLSTIRHADVIFVVKDSQLVERGTHDELMAGAASTRSSWGRRPPRRRRCDSPVSRALRLAP